MPPVAPSHRVSRARPDARFQTDADDSVGPEQVEVEFSAEWPAEVPMARHDTCLDMRGGARAPACVDMCTDEVQM